ncbi:MAG: hypothetical protein ACK43J_10225 [Chitinophagaceae bacterium]|jgi:hypothetical protein
MEQKKRVPKWIRVVGLIIFTLTLLLYLLIYVGQKEIKGDIAEFVYDSEHKIIYSPNYFDERFLKNVGDSLRGFGLFVPSQSMDIQLERSTELGDTVVVAFFVNPDKLTDAAKTTFVQAVYYMSPLLQTYIKIQYKDPTYIVVGEQLIL